MMPTSRFISAGRRPFARWQGPLAELQHRPGRGGHRPRWLTAGCPYPRPPGSCSAGPCRSRRSSTVAPPWPPASALPAPPRDAVPGLRDSAACLEAAALRVDAGLDALSLVITTDRTSNGPVLTWPAPSVARRGVQAGALGARQLPA